jgi:O-antigen/teichoic acid export membrane protein
MFDKIKRLLGHTLVYGFGNSGSRFVGFLLIPMYTRYLSPEDYGVLALVGLLGQILYMVMSMGQGTAVFRTYFNHDDRERRDEVITTSLWLILLVSFPIAFVTLAVNKPLTIVLTGKPDYAVWVMLGSLVVAFKCLMRLPLSVLRAREQSWRYAVWSFVQTVAGLVLAIAFVAGLHLGGQGVLLSQLLAEVIVCVYLVPATIKGLSLKFSRKDAWDLLGYGVYQIPTAALGFLLHMADRYFLKHYADLHSVGIYSLGYRFGELLWIPIMAFSLAWAPFLFEHRKSKDAPALFARVCTYFAAIMGMLWLGVALLSQEIITIMARPAFHEAYRVVPWIAGAFFFQGLAYVASIGFVLDRKIKYRPLVLAAATVINLGLNYLLVPRYAMMGAAVAGCVSFFLWFLLQAAVAQRIYAVPYEYGRVARLVVVGAAIYTVGMAIGWGSVWTALLGKSILFLCAPLLLHISGFFVPGEMTELTQSLFRKRMRRLVEARGATK